MKVPFILRISSCIKANHTNIFMVCLLFMAHSVIRFNGPITTMLKDSYFTLFNLQDNDHTRCFQTTIVTRCHYVGLAFSNFVWAGFQFNWIPVFYPGLSANLTSITKLPVNMKPLGKTGSKTFMLLTTRNNCQSSRVHSFIVFFRVKLFSALSPSAILPDNLRMDGNWCIIVIRYTHKCLLYLKP